MVCEIRVRLGLNVLINTLQYHRMCDVGIEGSFLVLQSSFKISVARVLFWRLGGIGVDHLLADDMENESIVLTSLSKAIKISIISFQRYVMTSG